MYACIHMCMYVCMHQSRCLYCFTVVMILLIHLLSSMCLVVLLQLTDAAVVVLGWRESDISAGAID